MPTEELQIAQTNSRAEDCYDPPFKTVNIEFRNWNSRSLRAYLDSPGSARAPLGVVLIAPAYGETKENNLLVSSYFAANGFSAVRFDWSDHVGESDGDIYTCTLSKMAADLSSLVHQCKLRWPGARVGIVGTSLGGRVALKFAARGEPIDFVICLAPVVNLRETLLNTYREDLVGRFISGRRYGVLDVLGFCIDADAFLDDAVRNGFADLSSSFADAQSVRAESLVIIGARDPWVSAPQARAVFERLAAARKQWCAIAVSSHRFAEKPAAVRSVLKQAVAFAGEFANSAAVREPTRDAVHGRRSAEKDVLKAKYECSQAVEREFWRAYLTGFKYICNIHDYWNLLERIYENLGAASGSQKILDVGCGNGNYAYFLLLKQAYKRLQYADAEAAAPCMYYGLDFVGEAIADARARIAELRRQFARTTGLAAANVRLLRDELVVADIDGGLPFETDSFDQVCCNLVLSYLRRPQESVVECARVLRPGGKLLVSTLKPDADLSQVYRNFVAVADDEQQIGEARKLLSNAGAIKLKEARGLYRFYSEKELRELVRRAGLTPVRVLRSFGDQANVVVARKSHGAA